MTTLRKALALAIVCAVFGACGPVVNLTPCQPIPQTIAITSDGRAVVCDNTCCIEAAMENGE